MKTEKYLFELIKSLSLAERRKIVDRWRELSTTGRKTYYEDMFECLSDLDNYDEKRFKEEHKDREFIRNFSYNKNYLYNKILQSLPNTSDSKNQILTDLNRDIEISGILISKGLYSQSLNILKKIAARSLHNEYFLEYIKSLNLTKIALLNTIPNRRIIQVTTELYDKIEFALKAFHEIQTASRLNNELIALVKEYGFGDVAKNNENLKRLFSNEFYSSDKKLSVDARVYYYGDKFIYYSLQNDLESAYEAAKRRAELVMKNQFYYEKYPICILSSLAELQTLLIELGKDTEFKKYFEIFSALRFKDDMNRNYWFTEKYFLYTTWLVRKKYFENIPLVIVSFEADSANYDLKERYSSTSRFSLYFLFSYSLFVIGDYEKSLKWLNTIINNDFRDMTDSEFAVFRILKLLVLHKLKSHILINSEIRSLRRFLTTNKNYSELGLALIKTIINFHQIKDSKLRRNELLSFRKLLTTNRTGSSYSEFSDKIDMVAWVDSELNGSSMLSVLKSKKEN